MWPYATLLYGHALAGGCLIASFLGALLVADSGPRSRTAIGVLTGLAAGWAVVTEYPAVIPGGIILLFALYRTWQRDRSTIVSDALTMGLGLACAAAVLIFYNWAAFGAPFHIGYTSEEGYEAMRTGIFGVNWPKLSVAWALLFGEYRGLLPLAPILALAPAGYWLLLRSSQTRAIAAIAAVVVVYYFLLTAGYAYWSGGWSYRIPPSRPGATLLGSWYPAAVGTRPAVAARAHPGTRSGRGGAIADRGGHDAATAG